jgi:hypothetical protein
MREAARILVNGGPELWETTGNGPPDVTNRCNRKWGIMRDGQAALNKKREPEENFLQKLK